MSQGKKGKLNYRCPCCFNRDIDIDLFFDEDKKEYYCLRCNYVGTEEDILRRYEEHKSKYKLMSSRIDRFED